MNDAPAWDYVIVGSGSAGAVVAARLSERADRSVLLLEAGGRDSAPSIHIPGRLEQVLTSRRLNWHYDGDPDASLDGRRLDGCLRVHGLAGLSVADASVMPFVTSGNTNIAVIAIAERAAGFIAGRTG